MNVYRPTVCEHGSLKHQCLICEQAEQLQAADALADAAKLMLDGHAILYRAYFNQKNPDGSYLYSPSDDLTRRELEAAIDAYLDLRK